MNEGKQWFCKEEGTDRNPNTEQRFETLFRVSCNLLDS